MSQKANVTESNGWEVLIGTLLEHAGEMAAASKGTPPTEKVARGTLTKKVARGRLTTFPERLRLDETDGVYAQTVDAGAAVDKAIQQDDVQTVFFINFPPKLETEARKNLVEIQDSVQSWQAWSSVLCEQKVQQKINESKLSGDISKEAMVARASYRTKIFDFLMRQAPWFAKTFDQNMSKKISVNNAELHTGILKAVLEGFLIPSSVLVQLEKVVSSISDGILGIGNQELAEGLQYWIMLTRYEYRELTQKVYPIIRVISFQITRTTREYVSGKSSFTQVDFDFAFSQHQCDFNSNIYGEVSKGIDQDLIEKGKRLTRLKEARRLLAITVLQFAYRARKDAVSPVNLDFDARVPISFSVFPSSYRSDTAVSSETKVKVEGETDLTSRVGREGIETRYTSYQSGRPRRDQQDFRQETRIYEERDRFADNRGRRGRENIDVDVDLEVERDRYYDKDFNYVDRRGARYDTDIDIDIRERGPAYGPTLERERLTVDDRRHRHDMGYYDEDGHYHSFRHGAHKAADRILHPFDHTYYERHHGGRHHGGGRDEVDVDVDINVGGPGGPRRSRDYDVREVDYEVRAGGVDGNYVSDNVRYVDRALSPNTITIPCHHIRVGDIVILQGRPCQVIRITTSASTGQHRYLGVDLFNKQMYEESSFSSNPSPSVYVQNMLGPVFKQYRVLDIRPDGRVVAMTETGSIKQGLPVLDQGSLYDRLQDAFANGRGSVRVLVIKDSGRELAVDYKVVSGSRL